MLADQFVTLVRAAAPPHSELLAAGLSEEQAEQIRRVFSCPRREGSQSASDADELQRLLTVFDCSLFELATFTFQSPPSSHPCGLLVGHLEADAVVLLPDGPVAVLAHDAPRPNAGSPCASTPGRFLDALGHRIRVGVRNTDRSPDLARACAELAGVAYPNQFWRTVAE
jgi:hypothetical protein